MTGREMVIKGLETIKQFFGYGLPSTAELFDSYYSILNNALALLKEQEPLEPIRVEIKQAGTLYHRCYCKKCWNHVGNMINNKVVDVHENFCSSCGQSVQWDD